MPDVRMMLILVWLLFAMPASASDTLLASPRLTALQAQLDGRDDDRDIAAFWADVRAKGTPLVERVVGEPTQMILTFLWREPTGRDHIDLGVFGPFNTAPWQTGDPLIRLARTDIWYRSYRVNAALRSQYMLIGSDGAAPGAKRQRTWSHTDEAGHDKEFDLFLDPLNRHTIDDVYFRPPSRENIFDGPDAPHETWLGKKPGGLRGKMLDLTIRSAILGNERKLAVYVPDPRLTRSKPPGLLILFDGPSYRTAGRVPEMLDRMIAAGVIAPTVAVMVDSITLDNRVKELAPNEPFARFIAEELMPMLRARFDLSSDPHKAVIAGASRGGLAAGFIAMKHPEIFGNVIAQSPALWWGPSQAEMDTHWLARAFESRDRLPIRFYIQTGTLEDATSMRGTSRHLQEVLQAKGYNVTYREFVGGHTFFNWRAILPQALAALLPGDKPWLALAIDNVTVIDPESGKSLTRRSVYIDDGRIVAIKASRAKPRQEADQRIDGTGRYLIPGLLDMHVHMAKRHTEGYSRRLFFANGVTGVRDMAADCWTPSDPNQLCIADMRRMQHEVENGEIIGPRLLRLASFPVDGPLFREDLPADVPKFFLPGTEQEGRELARHLKGRGVDLVKIYKTIPRAAYAGLADEAKTLGLEFSGHIPEAVAVTDAVAMGQRTVEHAQTIPYDCGSAGTEYRDAMSNYVDMMPGAANVPHETRIRQSLGTYDPARCRTVLAALKANGTYYVPTHKTREMDARASEPAYRKDPQLRYVARKTIDGWAEDLNDTAAASPELKALYEKFLAHGLLITRMAQDAGVKLMVGTDANDTMIIPGFSLHDEFRFYAQAGVSNMAILRAATTVPAEYLGRLADLGGIGPGRLADLVMLYADPLADIGNTSRISAVIFGGRFYDRGQLDRLLDDVESMQRASAQH